MDKSLFAGVQIDTTADGFELGKEHYVKCLKILLKDCTFSDFRSLGYKLAWITHTRPELSCAVNMAAQVTEKTFSLDDIKELNRVVVHIRKTPSQKLTYVKLDKDSLRIKVYADSSFANNKDNSSQIGYIILLVDKFNTCNILNYSSRKSRRVTRSVFGGELYAFADAFDRAYIL